MVMREVMAKKQAMVEAWGPICGAGHEISYRANVLASLMATEKVV
jgi:hypothetical protein